MAKKKDKDRKTSERPAPAALRRAVRQPEGEAEAAVALKELIGRADPGSSALLREVAQDPERPTQIRATAVVGLGHRSTKAHRETLLELLEAEDPTVVRRAAQALSRIGGAPALERMGRMRPRDDVVKRALEAARTVLAYRTGAPAPRLSAPDPEALVRPGRSKTHPLEIGKLPAREVEGVREQIAHAVPELSPAEESLYRLDCGRGRYLVVFDAKLTRRQGLAAVGEGSMVVGAVLERDAIDGTYHLAAHLLTHPARGHAAHLFAVRESGEVLYYGDLRLGDEGVEFEVAALKVRGAQPLTIRGAARTAEGIRLDVEEAVVATRRSPEQPPPMRPRRIRP